MTMDMDISLSMSNTSSPPPGLDMEEESTSSGNQHLIIDSLFPLRNGPHVHVGQKIEVQWTSNGEYYPCSVVDYSACTHRTKVIYPRCQNAVEEFLLTEREWRVAKRSRGRPLLDMLVGKQIQITNNTELAQTFLSESLTLRCYVLRRAGPGRYDLLFLDSDRIAKGQNLSGVEYTIVGGHTDNIGVHGVVPGHETYGGDHLSMSNVANLDPPPPPLPPFHGNNNSDIDDNMDREEFHRILFNRFYLHNIPLLPEEL